jgi:hypothetical protein
MPREVCSPTLDKRSKAAARRRVSSYERRLTRTQLLTSRIIKSKQGAAGPEFNKEHAHCFFRREGIVRREFVPHPPYSPDIASSDFALFPKLKMELKGRRFETVSDIEKESQAVLDSIKENDFHGTFEAWKKR